MRVFDWWWLSECWLLRLFVRCWWDSICFSFEDCRVLGLQRACYGRVEGLVSTWDDGFFLETYVKVREDHYTLGVELLLFICFHFVARFWVYCRIALSLFALLYYYTASSSVYSFQRLCWALCMMCPYTFTGVDEWWKWRWTLLNLWTYILWCTKDVARCRLWIDSSSAENSPLCCWATSHRQLLLL